MFITLTALNSYLNAEAYNLRKGGERRFVLELQWVDEKKKGSNFRVDEFRVSSCTRVP